MPKIVAPEPVDEIVNGGIDLDRKEFQQLVNDPLAFARVCWPNMVVYDRQEEITESLINNDETVVTAGNQLGKDFITAFLVVWYFCSRVPCKIVTVAPGETQLETVLWGEIRRLLQTSEIKLPIKYNHLSCRYVQEDGNYDPQSILLGLCTNKAENLQGQHLPRGPKGEPRTLAVFDEASGVQDIFYTGVDSWSHRRLIIGNPLQCANFFYRFVEAGDIKDDDSDHYIRKVIKIKASDSPNVRLAEEEIKLGKKPSHRILIPGVVSYRDYVVRRKTWDPVRQCVGLDAEFYKGASNLLYPPQWLNHAEEVHRRLPSGKKRRKALAMGLDPGEGSAETVWTLVDSDGIIAQVCEVSHDTSTIVGRTIALMEEYDVSPTDVLIDLGGGGKQYADLLRAQDYEVRTIAFGGGPIPPDVPDNMLVDDDKKEAAERRRAYKNKRAEMYGELRDLLDPTAEGGGTFGIPEELVELRRQLAPLPLLYDSEGKMFLPPKEKPTENYKGQTIHSILGCSPDQADSLVLAIHGMLHQATPIVVGAWN